MRISQVKTSEAAIFGRVLQPEEATWISRRPK